MADPERLHLAQTQNRSRNQIHRVDQWERPPPPRVYRSPRRQIATRLFPGNPEACSRIAFSAQLLALSGGSARPLAFSRRRVVFANTLIQGLVSAASAMKRLARA